MDGISEFTKWVTSTTDKQLSLKINNANVAQRQQDKRGYLG